MTLSRVLLLPVVLVLYLFSVFWVGTVLQLQAVFHGEQDFPSIPTRVEIPGRVTETVEWDKCARRQRCKQDGEQAAITIDQHNRGGFRFVILASILMFGSRCGVFALCM